MIRRKTALKKLKLLENNYARLHESQEEFQKDWKTIRGLIDKIGLAGLLSNYSALHLLNRF